MMFDRVLENNYITRDETGAMDDSDVNAAGLVCVVVKSKRS